MFVLKYAWQSPGKPEKTCWATFSERKQAADFSEALFENHQSCRWLRLYDITASRCIIAAGHDGKDEGGE